MNAIKFFSHTKYNLHKIFTIAIRIKNAYILYFHVTYIKTTQFGIIGYIMVVVVSEICLNALPI